MAGENCLMQGHRDDFSRELPGRDLGRPCLSGGNQGLFQKWINVRFQPVHACRSASLRACEQRGQEWAAPFETLCG
jgi:hypothetical protein